jgi:hypothetical protein
VPATSSPHGFTQKSSQKAHRILAKPDLELLKTVRDLAWQEQRNRTVARSVMKCSKKWWTQRKLPNSGDIYESSEIHSL